MCAPQTRVGRVLHGQTWQTDDERGIVASTLDPVGTTGEGKGIKPIDPNAPPKAPDLSAPDLTDDAIRRERSSELLRVKTGQGRRSTFLTGPMGSTGSVTAPSLSAAPAPAQGPLPTLLNTKKKNPYFFGG